VASPEILESHLLLENVLLISSDPEPTVEEMKVDKNKGLPSGRENPRTKRITIPASTHAAEQAMKEASKEGLLPHEKATPIVFYSTGGMRSSWAVVALRNLGYTNAINGGADDHVRYTMDKVWGGKAMEKPPDAQIKVEGRVNSASSSKDELGL